MANFTDRELAIGYKEMGEINLALANEALSADSEQLKQYEAGIR